MATATYTPIATTTVSSATSAVTFNSISNQYTDLRLVLTGSDTNNYVLIRFNNDSSAIYSRTFLYGDGTNAYSNNSSNITSLYCTANSTSFGTLDIMNANNTTTYKTSLVEETMTNEVSRTVYLYRSTSAISRIDILSPSGTNSITSGTYTLYGIKAA